MRLAREDALLDAAMELFGERGYAAATMDDLAARAHVSKATLYQHFPSKESLATRVVLRTIARTLDTMRSLDQGRPAIERFEICLRQTLRNRFEVARIAGDALSSLQAIVMDDPEYRARHAELIEVLTGMLRQAQAEGALDPALDCALLARLPVAIIRDVDLPRLVHSGACSARALTDTIVTVILRGMGAPHAVKEA